MLNRLTTIALAVTCVVGAHADDHFIVRATIPSSASDMARVPVTADIRIADMCAAMQVDEIPLDTTLIASEKLGEGMLRGLVAQLNRVGPNTARVHLLLSPEPAGPREITVYLEGAPDGIPAPEALPEIEVRRRGDAIDVVGEGFSVTHDPAKMAGLPSAFGFTDTGKIFDSFELNDRVYDKALGGFYLRNDPEPVVELLGAGPVCVEVRVTARYLSDGGAAPDSHPRAAYTFRYYPGLPMVEVSADIEQDSAFEWKELHFIEINFKDDSFTHWAADDPNNLVEFIGAKKSGSGSKWGALVDGANVLGLTGNIKMWDDAAGYGNYLHGPWVGWNAAEAHFRAWLWVGSGDDALQRMAADVGAVGTSAPALALAPRLADALAELEQATLPADGGPLAWRVSLLESALAQGGSQMDALAAAEAMLQVAKADMAGIVARVPAVLGGRLFLKRAGTLGVGLRVDGDRLEIVSLFDMNRRREMLAAPSSLFSLVLSDADGKQVTLRTNDGLVVEEARGLEEGNEMVVRFAAEPDTGIEGLIATLTMTMSADGLAMDLSVDNATDWSLERVNIPEVAIGALGDDPSDDVAYGPRGFGVGYPNPTGRSTRYTGYYPSGGCVVQFMMMTDEAGGVYVATHDPTASTKTLRFQSDGAGTGLRMSVEIPAPDASLPGNDFELEGEAILASVGGGWYPATQKYRAWLAANAPWWPEPDDEFSRSDRPQWLEDTSIWVLTGGGSESVVEPTKQFAEYMGVPTAVHWYNWHQIPFDNDYPHYFPTKPGFAEGVAELQAVGVRVAPYINGRLWDTDTPDFATDGIKWCTKDRDGEPYTEVYGSGQKLAAMCPTQEPWRQILYDLVMRLVGDEVGVDGVYMDQIAAARPRLCYDQTHGHPLVGGHWWVDGYWNLLDRIQRGIAEVSPDKMLTTESNAEPYAKYFDTYLMCNSLGNNLVPIFPAVYGGKMLMFGRYMSQPNWDDLSAMAQKQGQLFVWGSQLWWSSPGVIKHEKAGPWLRDLARVRHQVREFFNHGRMLPPPTLEGNDATVTADWRRRKPGDMMVTTPAVLATTWQVADGRVMIPMTNCSGESRTVTVRLDHSAAGWDAKATVKISRINPGGVEELATVGANVAQDITLSPFKSCALVLAPAEG